MKKSEKLDIGHLHQDYKFKKGYYVYIGSAMNSLVARIKKKERILCLHRFSHEFTCCKNKQAFV